MSACNNDDCSNNNDTCVCVCKSRYIITRCSALSYVWDAAGTLPTWQSPTMAMMSSAEDISTRADGRASKRMMNFITRRRHSFRFISRGNSAIARSKGCVVTRICTQDFIAVELYKLASPHRGTVLNK